MPGCLPDLTGDNAAKQDDLGYFLCPFSASVYIGKDPFIAMEVGGGTWSINTEVECAVTCKRLVDEAWKLLRWDPQKKTHRWEKNRDTYRRCRYLIGRVSAAEDLRERTVWHLRHAPPRQMAALSESSTRCPESTQATHFLANNRLVWRRSLARV